MLSSSGTTWNSASTASCVVHRQLGEDRRRHLLRVARDDRRVGPAQSAPTASATVIWDASSKTTRSKLIDPGGTNRASESGLTSTHGVIAPITSPYCSTSRRTLRPPRVRPISRSSAPTLPKNAPGRNGRRSSSAAGSAVDSDDRSRSDASTNRPTVRSCRSASNDPNPAASHRSDTDAAASPRSRASGPSSGDTAPVSSAQRASPSASPSGASASLASTHRPKAAHRVAGPRVRSAAVAAHVRSSPRPRANRASSSDDPPVCATAADTARPAASSVRCSAGPSGVTKRREAWTPSDEVRRQPGQQVAVALDGGHRVRHRLPAGLGQDVDRRVEGGAARQPAPGQGDVADQAADAGDLLDDGRQRLRVDLGPGSEVGQDRRRGADAAGPCGR